jgi:adenylylsulfate kinase
MTGLPCSGKSTIARKLHEHLPDLEILDGDELYEWLKPDGWSRESRITNNKRIAHIAKLLLKHNISVCVSIVSPYSEGRKAARDIVNDNRFIETYIKCKLEVCESRDVKGMYKRARSGEIVNFTGVNGEYETPSNPDLIIDTEKSSLVEEVIKIIQYLKSRELIPSTN